MNSVQPDLSQDCKLENQLQEMNYTQLEILKIVLIIDMKEIFAFLRLDIHEESLA